MTLTVGIGPFGQQPSGRFDFEPPDRVTFVELHRPRVRATKAGETVVDSTRVRLVYRTGSLPVFAFPAEDVRVDLLSLSEVRTGCAYKGFPIHFDHGSSRAVAWSYTEPRRDAERVRDRICFYQEREEVELRVDGVVVERPTTPWSGTGWIAA